MNIGFLNVFWKILISPAVAVVDIILIALLVAVGSIIPQGLAPAEYNIWINRLELGDVYHSWLLLALLFYLFASLLACSVRRAWSLLGKSFCWRNFNSIIIHLSIMFILVGGYLEQAYGERGYLRLSGDNFSGELTAESRYGLVKTIPLAFALRSLEFQVVQDQAGGMVDYRSVIEILYNGQRYQQLLAVGNPIIINGYNVSQASYYRDAGGNLRAIVEIASHPGKVWLVLGGIFLLLGVCGLLVPKNRAVSKADSQPLPDQPA